MTTGALIDMGRGEPDFDTPDHVKEAACRAVAENFTKYTPQPGMPELREAIVAKFNAENGIGVSTDQVVVSCGGKHSAELAIRALVRPDDEVVLVTPYWLAYPGQVRFAGGRPVMVTALEQEGFVPSPVNVRAAITPATRMLILNSPSNPTGAVYRRERLEELAEVALKHDLMVLSDEVYERIVFDGAEHCSIASLGPEIAEHTITVNSVSKTHAMTGWRVGYAALPGDLAERVVAIQQVSTSAPSAVSQRAALAALTGDQSHVAQMVAAYAERRAYTLKRIRHIPSLLTAPPSGTFYCFVNIEALLGRTCEGQPLQDVNDFAVALREKAGVNVVSGMGFGSKGHVRISFALGLDALREGFDRIERWIDTLEEEEVRESEELEESETDEDHGD